MLDITYKLVTNAKLISNRAAWNTTVKHGAHLCDLTISDAARRSGMAGPSALVTVTVVVNEGTKFKVSSIATKGNIAAVTHDGTFWNWSIGKFVAEAMNTDLSAAVSATAGPNDAIRPALCSGPEPTVIRTGNRHALPKAAREGCTAMGGKALLGTVEPALIATGDERGTDGAYSCYCGHCQTPIQFGRATSVDALRGFVLA